jgi:hypothetical protein
MNTVEKTKNTAVIQNLDLNDPVKCYINRNDRSNHPEGHFDSGSRWYPLKSENCECCKYIRVPSRAYPYRLQTHCRSITHIANLYKVDESSLRKAINAYKKSQLDKTSA